MIEIIINNNFFQYDAYHMTKAFYPNQTIKTMVVEEGGYPLSYRVDEVDKFHISETICGQLPDKEDAEGRKQCKYKLNVELYRNLFLLSGKKLDWGILMGVRPTKVAMKRWKQEGTSKEEVIGWLQDYYKVKEEKAELAMDIAMREERLIRDLDLEDGYSLYIGIPFCRTRCSYCSFTAYPLHLWEHRIDEYMDALCRELAFVASVSKNKKLNTIYIGGGTPTSLTAQQLDQLLTCIETEFSYEHLQEITVEAGRPDSITREKLEVIKKHQVERISINPQTMQEKTLKIIGREHSVQDIYDVYQDARELGFANINMDLIVGLPGETLEDVEDTLKKIQELKPDSLTVHSLAMKRTSKLTLSGEKVHEEYPMHEMVDLAADYAGKMGLLPYYLYRQKNMAGNYENVGYAKVDKAGIYNILIMEEKQSIVAVGAGASTKIVLKREKDNIVRIENVKDVNEYITRIDEMIERKGEWLWH